jgi:hypothetical protein
MQKRQGECDADHLPCGGGPAQCGPAYAGPNHSLLTWEGDSEWLRSTYLADSPFIRAHIVTLIIDAAVTALLLPGLLSIRAALSQQPSNNV